MVNKRLRRKQRQSQSTLLADVFRVLACALTLPLISHTGGSTTTLAQSSSMSLSYNDLKPCNLSSVEMSSLDPSVIVVPCIAWDVGPYNNTNDNDSMSNVSISSPLITVIQVTPPQCSNHRDGAPTAVELLNSQNNGRGPAIGSKKDHYVQFRFVAVVAGSIADADNNDQEGQDHKTILKSMIDTLNPHYIMGTCTFVAAHERQIALEYKRILVAQAISDLAHKYGFNDTVDYKFDPFADDDNNTVVNSMDADYLIDLADSVCGPGSLTDVFPAIFCVYQWERRCSAEPMEGKWLSTSQSVDDSGHAKVGHGQSRCGALHPRGCAMASFLFPTGMTFSNLVLIS
ncbi:hypothetical protein MHU86_18482 [Fragilaria crotonensis]|nr:hypothetical protein MHU86_18482 [Fragilaria crotonensis]